MPGLRQDPLTGNWVLIAPERRHRPSYLDVPPMEKLEPGLCPFCEGNEDLTPPEIDAWRPQGGEPNKPGWRVRVFANKFPALRVEGEPVETRSGIFVIHSAIGAHEVVAETPAHDLRMGDTDPRHIREVFLAFKRRIIDLRGDVRLRYIQVFKNSGALAGATIPHPHSQILALPLVPAAVEERLKRARALHTEHGKCFFCGVIQKAVNEKKRLLLEDEEFVVVAPYAPAFPFQLRLMGRTHRCRFEETPDGEFLNLAAALKEAMGMIERGLGDPSYHLILHNAPFEAGCEEFYHWHLDIVPRISGIGGFEHATGCYINPFPPEEAVSELRKF